MFAMLYMVTPSWSQTKVDEDLLKSANKVFDAGKYLEALDLFRSLLSVSPENHELNLKYGACLIYSDEDTAEPIKYLKYATEAKFPMAYYFLGKAYHLNYQFADAEKAFTKFIKDADKKQKAKYSDYNQLLSMTQSGQKLLNNIKDIVVLDKTETSESAFFRSYNTAQLEGKVIATPEDLLSKKDKSSNEPSLIHFSGGASVIYFSSYGADDQRDIYKARRLDNGKYTKPVKLSNGVNTQYDENYPFLHPDGQTLYFSSKGHNSMGGYDVFKSILNPNTGEFGAPVNLDFAINSPADDVMYISDLNNKTAVFSSNRSSANGRLHVYHVEVASDVASLTILKGKYIATDASKPITIRIEDALTNNEIGVYQSDPKTGEYIINLPRSGKYKFFVEEEGENMVHSGIFETPKSRGSVVYAQEMTFSKANGGKQFVLNNLFENPLEEDVSALVAEALKMKARLEINKDNFVAEEAPSEAEMDVEAILSKSGFDNNESIEDILASSKSMADKFAQQSTEDTGDAQTLFAFAQKMKSQADQSLADSKSTLESANNESDNTSKEALIVEAAWHKKNANKEYQDAVNALSVIKEIEGNSLKKYNRYTQIVENVGEVENNMSSQDGQQLVESLKANKAIAEKGEMPGILEIIQKDTQEKIRLSKRSLEFAQQMDTEVRQLRDKVKIREKQVENTSKKKDKEILTQELAGLNEELSDYKDQTDKAYKKYETRLNDQSNSENRGKLFAEYKLKSEGDLWSGMQPVEYSSEDVAAITNDLRKAKREVAKVKIDDVQVSQLLAERSDLSHKFDFGEINHDVSHSGDEVAEEIPEDLEFIEDEVQDTPEDNIQVLEKVIETDEAYEMFLLNTKGGENAVKTYDLKLIEYEASKIDASEEEVVILNQRIDAINALKLDLSEAVADQERLAIYEDIKPEVKAMAKNDFNALSEGEMVDWIAENYQRQKQEIIASSFTDEEKQKAYQNLNTTFRAKVGTTKTELLNIYTVEHIAGTVKAKDNLSYLDDLSTRYGEEMVLELPEDVVQIDEDVIVDDPLDIVDNTEVDPQIILPGDTLSETTETTSDMPATTDVDREPLTKEDVMRTSLAANVKDITQENLLRLRLVEDQDKTDEEKMISKINYNQNYLEQLKTKLQSNLELIDENPSSSNSLLAENEALKSLIFNVKANVKQENIRYAEMNNLVYNDIDLEISKYRNSYFLEVAQLNENTTDSLDRMKKRIVLDNMIAYDLEDKIRLIKIELQDEALSTVKRKFLTDKLDDYERNYNSIREQNAIVINELGVGMTENEVYQRQKLRSYIADDFERPIDYTEYIQLNGYLDVSHHNEAAAKIQSQAYYDLIALKENNLDDEAYKKAEDTIGERMAMANELELVGLNESINAVDFNEAFEAGDNKSQSLSYLEKGNRWEAKADSIKLLLVDAIGVEKNQLLKKHVAAQLNAIEYKRQSKAIVNYVAGDQSEPLVFDDFAVPNSAFSAMQDSPNYDLADLVFETHYVAPQYKADAETAIAVVDDGTLENPTGQDSIIEADDTDLASEDQTDNPQDLDGSDTPVDDVNIVDIQRDSVDAIVPNPLDELVLIQTDELDNDDLANAVIRMNKESVKQALPINENGVPLSISRSTEIDNNASESDTDTMIKLMKKKSLIVQLEEMIADQTAWQTTYKENKFLKEQGLVVVNEALNTDGKTAVLVNEHNRIVADLKQLDLNTAIAKDNVMLMDLQIDRENDAVTLLERQIEAEAATVDFESDSGDIPLIPSTSLSRNVFVLNNNNPAATYTTDNPIPIDPVMPDGIIYQVQVGAYRKPIPQDLFKGFAPIMGQKIHSGIVRYKVGLFTDYNSANEAKNSIRSMGYSDAFVVTFNNGERISVAAANQLVNNGDVADSGATDNNDGNTGTNNIDNSPNDGVADDPATSNTTGQIDNITTDDGTDNTNVTVGTGIIDLDDYPFTEDNAKDDYYDNPEAATATQVEMMKGLFYTVQIGAYTKPVTSGQLNNISPLNTELTSTGIIRYTSGVYTSMTDASNYKSEVNAKGIPDAFVSAYYNGYRINLSKARELFDIYGNEVWVDGTMRNAGSISDTPVTPPPTDTPATVATSAPRDKDEVLDAAYSLIESGMPTQEIWDLLTEEGLLEAVSDEDNTFKVILGPFVEAIPTREVEIILNFRDNIQFEEKGENEYVYSSIKPIPYKEARNLKQLLEEEGIDSAKIVSFKNGKEISLKDFLDGL